MLTEESFKNFKTRRLKNICKSLCRFDKRWSFFDDKYCSAFDIDDDVLLLQSCENTPRKRYIDLILTLNRFVSDRTRWDRIRYEKMPEFDSIEELCIKIDLLGYDI